MSDDAEITPEALVKSNLEEAVHEWVAHHHGPEACVVEYIVVAKCYKPGMGPAHFLYGWKTNPDSDALLGMLARVKRYILRTQDSPQRNN